MNCIYPGLVPTAMGAGLANDVAALGLFGSPEEAVGAVVGLTPPAGSVRWATWPTPWYSSPPTPRGSSTASACRSTAEWGCDTTARPTKPVVVYGASGYTGRLVCEYLREYDVPFVAAGRDGGSSRSSMESHVAGIETADYEIVEVTHDVEALTELFAGASGGLRHGRAVQQATAPRSSRRASPAASTTSTPPASRTG